jgi:hypothetical protein
MESEELAAHHHQSRAPQSRCPYRAGNTTEAPMFNYAGYHHQPHPPFHNHNPAHFNNQVSQPGPVWDNAIRTTLPSYHTLSTGTAFGGHSNGGNVQGRAPELANFDSFMHPLDPRAPVYHSQSRAPQESSRQPNQVTQGNDQASRGAGSHTSAGRNSNHSSFSSNQSPPRMPDVTSRPEWTPAQFDMTLPILNNPRSQITLPPPQPQFPYADIYMNSQYHFAQPSRYIPHLDQHPAPQSE